MGGLMYYLKKFAYSTVTSADLWATLAGPLGEL